MRTGIQAKGLFLFTVFLFRPPERLLAQGFSGETELATDGKGQSSFSQYVFYDFNNINILTRFFWINHVFEKGEFATGPTIRLGHANILKLQFGGTTKREVMVAGALITGIRDHGIVYIADAKLATETGAPSNLYQQLFIALNKKGNWQFEAQDLQVGGEQSFLRIGLEYRQALPHKLQLYVAPFYDPVRNAVGGQAGFRFF